MANLKSSKKRIELSRRQALRNRSRKSELKTYGKKFEQAIEDKNVDLAKELLQLLDKKLKRASLNNVIHENAASRRLSKYQRQLNEIMA